MNKGSVVFGCQILMPAIPFFVIVAVKCLYLSGPALPILLSRAITGLAIGGGAAGWLATISLVNQSANTFYGVKDDRIFTTSRMFPGLVKKRAENVR
jgi:hypothetical protein